MLVAAVLSLALLVAVGVWAFRDDGPLDTRSPAERAAATASASAKAAAKRAAAAASASAAAASSAAAAAAAARQAAAAALPGDLDSTLGGGGDTWSLSLLDLTTGVATTLGATSGMYTGSTIKVAILETLLRTQGGVDNLSDSEQQLATAMITESDNEAALSLWNAGGGDAALQQTLNLLGTTATTIAPDGYFGVSTTSAADQIKVLQQLVTPTFLTAADVAYVNDLMSNIEADQRWGVPTMADPGTATENKNGWLNNDDDDGKWLVNSLGIVTIGGQRYLVAAFSQHQPDFDTGVERLNAALAQVAATLR